MKKLSKAALGAKLLKKKAKDLGMKATASSSYFSMGNSVTVKVLSGTDAALKTLKDDAIKYEAGSFDGMNDIYNYDNVRDDIPQTKYLFIEDLRAEEIMKGFVGNKYDDLDFKINGEKVRTYYDVVKKLKEICEEEDGWQHILKAMVRENFKFPFGKTGWLIECKNTYKCESCESKGYFENVEAVGINDPKDPYSKPHIERCDSCKVFGSDHEAKKYHQLKKEAA